MLQRLRIWRYRLLSRRIDGEPVRIQPVLFSGRGRISVGRHVRFGWTESPHLHSGYGYVEARTPESSVEIGSDTVLNNNCVVVSAGPGISIGPKCNIGVGVEIFDSDFHGGGVGRVKIGREVFVGSGARILKGVTIGDGATVGAGAVVTSDVPAGALAVGNPAVTRERQFPSSRSRQPVSL